MTTENRQHDQVVAVYERANRIFSGLSVTCELEPAGDIFDFTEMTLKEAPPAWSLGSRIVFALESVERSLSSPKARAALAGLNFHELGHVLYTPKPDSWMRTKLSEWQGRELAFNALEDQRIETLLAASYPALAGHFVQAFQSFVVENTETVYTSHLLAHGRHFLPGPLREVLRAEFVGAWDERAEAEAIIDQYRTLVLGPEESDDAQVAVALVARFARLVQDLGEKVPSRPHGIGYGGSVTTLMQIDAQRARELLESGAPVALGAVGQSTRRSPNRRHEHRSASVLRRRTPCGPTLIENRTLRTAAVPRAYVDAARRFRVELDRLRGDADAGWIRRQSSGRLNVQRAMLGTSPDAAFDRWTDASFDAADIEAVLLLDASGSMLESITEACAAAWAIKRAVEAIGGRTTILSYACEAGLVHGAGIRAEATTMRVIDAEGGNEPVAALDSARAILGASHAANRMLITLADGDWGSEEETAHRIVDDVRDLGAMTAIGLLGRYVADDPHHHEVAIRLSRPSALVTMARDLVRGSGRRRTTA
ncbi:MAG: vWA domain-containing protein [Nocardioides sp.]|uniref:hypothetical protein n=1 Tax=Nocardioides sp. TaxID=35761 RepID=UPI0039E2A6B3